MSGDGLRGRSGVGDPLAPPPQLSPLAGPSFELALLPYSIEALRLSRDDDDPMVAAAITLVRNVQRDWTIDLVDVYGRVESTSGVSAATLSLRKSKTDVTSVLERSMATSGISFPQSGTIKISGITPIEWPTIAVGSYVGRVIMTISGVIVPTATFRVDVEERVAT